MTVNSRNGNTLLESGFFAPCRVATTAAITLAGLQTIDGIVLADGDRVLVKNQADATGNGIYAASSGNWVRTSDAAGNSDFFNGMAVLAALGTVNAGLIFICTCTDDPVVVGTSQLTFATQGAVQTAQQQSTSTSSLTVGTGSKTFATQSGKAFTVGQWVVAVETATLGTAAQNVMYGQVTAYSGGNLTVSVASTSGSGIHADWSIYLANSAAAAGISPPVGTGNVTGPGSAVDGNLPAYDGATGKLLKDSGKAAGTLASRNQLQFGDAASGAIRGSDLAAGAAPLPYAGSVPNDNLNIGNDGTSPTRDISISVGRCRDMLDLTNLQLAGAMVKRLDLAWAAGGQSGAPAGALDTGSARLASKTYHIYLIGKLGMVATQRSRTSNVATLSVTGHGLGVGGSVRVQGVGAGYDGVAVVSAVTTNTLSYANTGADEGATVVSGPVVDGFDVLASQQDVNAYPSPVLPSGWIAKQCLGSIMTDGSINNRSFLQYGDTFLWGSPPLDINAQTANANYALTVPLGVVIDAMYNIGMTFNGVTATVQIRNPGVNAAAESSLAGTNSGAAAAHTFGRCLTNTSAQITATITSASLSLSTLGYRDLRRRFF